MTAPAHMTEQELRALADEAREFIVDHVDLPHGPSTHLQGPPACQSPFRRIARERHLLGMRNQQERGAARSVEVGVLTNKQERAYHHRPADDEGRGDTERVAPRAE